MKLTIILALDFLVHSFGRLFFQMSFDLSSFSVGYKP